MKTSLSHLPENNQIEIRRIAEIIRETSNPEMILLYGSYAKGTFTEHTYTGRDGIRYGYFSDYDLLVVTKEPKEKSYELEDVVVNRSRMYQSSVNMEIHDIDHINYGLERGQYFFTDIIREGILLFDTGNLQFATPRELTPTEQKEIAQQYFDKWYPQSSPLILTSEFAAENGNLKLAAFLLHQATETLFYTTLLVVTSYKPKTHNLGKLRKLTKELSEEIYLIFPAESSKKEKHLFDLLKRGYVDARYRDDYYISKEELTILNERVKEMLELVKSISLKKIESIS